MRLRWAVALGVGALLGLATASSAQVSPEEWHKGTALSLFGGGASATGGTDVAARPVTVYGVHLVYHFEEHPITP